MLFHITDNKMQHDDDDSDDYPNAAKHNRSDTCVNIASNPWNTKYYSIISISWSHNQITQYITNMIVQQNYNSYTS